VDGFTKFLDKLLDLLIQCHLRAARNTSDLAAGIPEGKTGGNGIAGNYEPMLRTEYAYLEVRRNEFALCRTATREQIPSNGQSRFQRRSL
jgi:hypothetical protein